MCEGPRLEHLPQAPRDVNPAIDFQIDLVLGNQYFGDSFRGNPILADVRLRFPLPTEYC